ncbi:hypothetical protein ABK040_001658 [Willaertia magna]
MKLSPIFILLLLSTVTIFVLCNKESKIRRRKDCGPVCYIYCPYGNKLDKRGCPTCTCRKGPDDDYYKENGLPRPYKHHPHEGPHCKKSKCPKRTGCVYQIDRNGCKVCVCKRCWPKSCVKWCKHGYVRDKFGCKTCKCFKKF